MANHDDPPPVKSSKAHRIWTVVRILQVRLRFIVLMVVVGLVAGNWENIMNHYDRWRRPAAVAAGEQPQEIEYYCAMHPNIIRSEPGNCPICGMPLVKRAKTAHGAELPAGVLAQVQLTPLKVEMGRIGVSPVEYRLLSREIRTVGITDYDETRRAFISARIKGRIDKLMVNYVGQQVKKGDPLASIYSPDLLVAQEELLLAVRGLEQQKGKPTEESARSLVDSARQKLSLWGITQEQIEEIIRRGKSETHLTIYSPMTGIVTEKKVLEGRYVNEGDDLYTIADLSQVWLQAKVFEDEIKGIQEGTAVEVTSTAYPSEIFAGRIGFVAYLVDPATRTVSARVEVLNPEYKLKPGMYVQAIIRLPLGTVTEPSAPAPPKNDERYVTGYYCPIYPDQLFDQPQTCPIDKFPIKRMTVEKVLAIPISAVINTGVRKIAYRQGDPGIFDMVEVVVGPRAGEFFPVLAGLKPGDQVAAAGSFLVDAENRLNPAAASQYFGASGGPQGGEPPSHAGHHH